MGQLSTSYLLHMSDREGDERDPSGAPSEAPSEAPSRAPSRGRSRDASRAPSRAPSTASAVPPSEDGSSETGRMSLRARVARPVDLYIESNRVDRQRLEVANRERNERRAQREADARAAEAREAEARDAEAREAIARGRGAPRGGARARAPPRGAARAAPPAQAPPRDPPRDPRITPAGVARDRARRRVVADGHESAPSNEEQAAAAANLLRIAADRRVEEDAEDDEEDEEAEENEDASRQLAVALAGFDPAVGGFDPESADAQALANRGGRDSPRRVPDEQIFIAGSAAEWNRSLIQWGMPGLATSEDSSVRRLTPAEMRAAVAEAAEARVRRSLESEGAFHEGMAVGIEFTDTDGTGDRRVVQVVLGARIDANTWNYNNFNGERLGVIPERDLVVLGETPRDRARYPHLMRPQEVGRPLNVRWMAPPRPRRPSLDLTPSRPIGPNLDLRPRVSPQEQQPQLPLQQQPAGSEPQASMFEQHTGPFSEGQRVYIAINQQAPRECTLRNPEGASGMWRVTILGDQGFDTVSSQHQVRFLRRVQPFGQPGPPQPDLPPLIHYEGPWEQGRLVQVVSSYGMDNDRRRRLVRLDTPLTDDTERWRVNDLEGGWGEFSRWSIYAAPPLEGAGSNEAAGVAADDAGPAPALAPDPAPAPAPAPDPDQAPAPVPENSRVLVPFCGPWEPGQAVIVSGRSAGTNERFRRLARLDHLDPDNSGRWSVIFSNGDTGLVTTRSVYVETSHLLQGVRRGEAAGAAAPAPAADPVPDPVPDPASAPEDAAIEAGEEVAQVYHPVSVGDSQVAALLAAGGSIVRPDPDLQLEAQWGIIESPGMGSVTITRFHIQQLWNHCTTHQQLTDNAVLQLVLNSPSVESLPENSDVLIFPNIFDAFSQLERTIPSTSMLTANMTNHVYVCVITLMFARASAAIDFVYVAYYRLPDNDFALNVSTQYQIRVRRNEDEFRTQAIQFHFSRLLPLFAALSVSVGLKRFPLMFRMNMQDNDFNRCSFSALMLIYAELERSGYRITEDIEELMAIMAEQNYDTHRASVTNSPPNFDTIMQADRDILGSLSHVNAITEWLALPQAAFADQDRAMIAMFENARLLPEEISRRDVGAGAGAEPEAGPLPAEPAPAAASAAAEEGPAAAEAAPAEAAPEVAAAAAAAEAAPAAAAAAAAAEEGTEEPAPAAAAARAESAPAEVPQAVAEIPSVEQPALSDIERQVQDLGRLFQPPAASAQAAENDDASDRRASRGRGSHSRGRGRGRGDSRVVSESPTPRGRGSRGPRRGRGASAGAEPGESMRVLRERADATLRGLDATAHPLITGEERHSLALATRSVLVELCRARSMNVGGSREVLIGRLAGTNRPSTPRAARAARQEPYPSYQRLTAEELGELWRVAESGKNALNAVIHIDDEGHEPVGVGVLVGQDIAADHVHGLINVLDSVIDHLRDTLNVEQPYNPFNPPNFQAAVIEIAREIVPRLNQIEFGYGMEHVDNRAELLRHVLALLQIAHELNMPPVFLPRGLSNPDDYADGLCLHCINDFISRCIVPGDVLSANVRGRVNVNVRNFLQYIREPLIELNLLFNLELFRDRVPYAANFLLGFNFRTLVRFIEITLQFIGDTSEDGDPIRDRIVDISTNIPAVRITIEALDAEDPTELDNSLHLLESALAVADGGADGSAAGGAEGAEDGAADGGAAEGGAAEGGPAESRVDDAADVRAEERVDEVERPVALGPRQAGSLQWNYGGRRAARAIVQDELREAAERAAELEARPPAPAQATFISPSTVFRLDWLPYTPDPVARFCRFVPRVEAVDQALFHRQGHYLKTNLSLSNRYWAVIASHDGDPVNSARVVLWGYHEDCPGRLALWPLLVSQDLVILHGSRFDSEVNWVVCDAGGFRLPDQAFRFCLVKHSALRDPNGLVGGWFTPVMPY